MSTKILKEDGTFWYQGRILQKSRYKPGVCYKWVYGDVIDVIDEFLTRGVDGEFVYGTNVRVIEEDFFTICNLNRCFV